MARKTVHLMAVFEDLLLFLLLLLLLLPLVFNVPLAVLSDTTFFKMSR